MRRASDFSTAVLHEERQSALSIASASNSEGAMPQQFSVDLRQSLYRLYCPPGRQEPWWSCPKKTWLGIRESSIRITCQQQRSNYSNFSLVTLLSSLRSQNVCFVPKNCTLKFKRVEKLAYSSTRARRIGTKLSGWQKETKQTLSVEVEQPSTKSSTEKRPGSTELRSQFYNAGPSFISACYCCWPSCHRKPIHNDFI